MGPFLLRLRDWGARTELRLPRETISKVDRGQEHHVYECTTAVVWPIYVAGFEDFLSDSWVPAINSGGVLAESPAG